MVHESFEQNFHKACSAVGSENYHKSRLFCHDPDIIPEGNEPQHAEYVWVKGCMQF
jgi:hypothetical protein